MARKDKEQDSENPGRLKQIALTYKMTKRVDRWIGLVISAVGLGTFGVVLGIGFLIGHPIYLGILGFLVALLTTAIVFGRRAERAAFSQMEGQPGAAAAVLENLRRGFAFTPAVAINRNQDVVHRAVGKCGVVLVGEGNPNRLKTLMAAEKRRMNRVVSDVPVHDVIVGTGEDQVPLKKLRTKVMKFPRVLPGHRVTEVNDRLRAMGDLMSNMPLPKGPMPKGMRLPKGGPQQRRGR
ncbi:DUF4191 domain-containing protein [Streptomyces carpaticus]|uniref:Uncharacterized protein n=2 Tax=Streptomyces TaxID=1883 RepID=A0A1I6RTF2_9ACTN|nr:MULTISPECIES: DUF4191 domain-containing protein [Streptomyces]MCK1816543.1 DUF4191 domain-containing protein [Streptomyces sp. XM4011]QKV68456.1 DUF4191 domain-containing protein [Streptomyces harbinensis]UWM48774.1 DUF4191 domain-containing protein [Streptomyces carpaticus]SFS67738.1 protein of unknown function [Streptomyces harbinensis]